MVIDKELERYIKKLIKDLESYDIEIREKAAIAFWDEFYALNFNFNGEPVDRNGEPRNIDRIKKFEKITKKIAIESLIEKILSNDNDSIKGPIRCCLNILKDPRVVGPFMQVLKNKKENNFVRESCAWYLVNLSEYSEKPLLEALKDDDKIVRRMSTLALGEIANPDYFDNLVKLFKDPDWNVRFKAVEALGKIGNEKALETLLVCLNDKSANVRRKSVEVMGLISVGEKILTRKELEEIYDPDRKYYGNI